MFKLFQWHSNKLLIFLLIFSDKKNSIVCPFSIWLLCSPTTVRNQKSTVDQTGGGQMDRSLTFWTRPHEFLNMLYTVILIKKETKRWGKINIFFRPFGLRSHNLFTISLRLIENKVLLCSIIITRQSGILHRGDYWRFSTEEYAGPSFTMTFSKLNRVKLYFSQLTTVFECSSGIVKCLFIPCLSKFISLRGILIVNL